MYKSFICETCFRLIFEMACKLWDVIFWDNCSDYVPSSWAANIDKTEYMWPTNISKIKIKKMVEDCLPLTEDINYSKVPAVYKLSASSLTDAKYFAEKGMLTSNFDSSDDALAPKSTKRKKQPELTSIMDDIDSLNGSEIITPSSSSRTTNETFISQPNDESELERNSSDHSFKRPSNLVIIKFGNINNQTKLNLF